MISRPATLADAAAIADIYNQGIEDGIATFETRRRTAEDVSAWFDGHHAIAVVEAQEPSSRTSHLIGFAATFGYRPRACYRGVAEISVYIDREFRRHGAGRLVLAHVIELAEAAGFWKLLSRVFSENRGSRGLVGSMGFRKVGVYEKHGSLDGVWRDIVIVERLIPANLS